MAKNNLSILIPGIIILVWSIILLPACRQQPLKTGSSGYYICPMDTQITQKDPGTCPLCKMDLVPIAEFRNAGNDKALDALLKPAYSHTVSSVKLVLPLEKKMDVTFTATGYIDYDTRAISNISSRYSGRIDKLYIKSVFQPLKKGQKLFDIYSPEIVTSQENLIYLLKNDSTAVNLINAEKRKLLLSGFTETQIKIVEKTLIPEIAIPVFSPCDGYVFTGVRSNNFTGKADKSTGMNEGGMNSLEPEGITGTSRTGFAIKEGIYVRKGQTLFNVVNTSKILAILMISSEDASKIKKGQAVDLSVENNPDSIIKSNIDFIEPIYEDKSVNMRVRVYLDNSKQLLKPGNWVRAVLYCEPAEGLWIPATSVLDLGRSKIVWLKENNSFAARRIISGRKIQDWVEVREGLWDDDSIAADAQYLMDSESFVKAAEDDEEK